MAKNDRRFTLSTKEKNPSPSKAWSRLGAGSGAHRTWKDAPHGPPQAEQSAAQAALRLRAEVLAREDCDPPGYLETLSREEAEHMLHELRVYQIELEMQNEELRRAHEEMALLRSRYFDLYDLAPVGYFSLDETGLIEEANLTAASLLGVTKGALAKKPLSRFIAPEDQDIYYLRCKQLMASGEPQTFELRMLNKEGVFFRAHLVATRADTQGSCRVVISAVSPR